MRSSAATSASWSLHTKYMFNFPRVLFILLLCFVPSFILTAIGNQSSASFQRPTSHILYMLSAATDSCVENNLPLTDVLKSLDFIQPAQFGTIFITGFRARYELPVTHLEVGLLCQYGTTAPCINCPLLTLLVLFLIAHCLQETKAATFINMLIIYNMIQSYLSLIHVVDIQDE